jgi:N-acetylmuramoyl-L-alanine amidase
MEGRAVKETYSDLLTVARWHLMTGKMPWSEPVTAALMKLIGDKLGYAAPNAPSEPIAPLPDPDASRLIALCMGHARPVDEGNVGAGGVSEEDYNLPLIEALCGELARRGINSMVISEYPPPGYEDAMVWLAHHLRKLGVTAAIEFHFNAANKRASGHEVLHWYKSERGVTLAKSLCDALTRTFPEHPNRGLKARTHLDRGALFMSLTHCPACIVEPFFGDTRREWDLFSSEEGMARLITAYADGIEDWLEKGGRT